MRLFIAININPVETYIKRAASIMRCSNNSRNLNFAQAYPFPPLFLRRIFRSRLQRRATASRTSPATPLVQVHDKCIRQETVQGQYLTVSALQAIDDQLAAGLAGESHRDWVCTGRSAGHGDHIIMSRPAVTMGSLQGLDRKTHVDNWYRHRYRQT